MKLSLRIDWANSRSFVSAKITIGLQTWWGIYVYTYVVTFEASVFENLVNNGVDEMVKG